MFTVKHSDTCGSRFFQTHNVYFESGMNKNGVEVGPKAVSFHDQEGAFHIFKQGSIFVMNESGKTVEQYHFYPGPDTVDMTGAEPIITTTSAGVPA